MEDTHWVWIKHILLWIVIRLNPCFNGRYSLSSVDKPIRGFVARLNPCFNGRYSLRHFRVSVQNKHDGLNPCFNGRYSLRLFILLIILIITMS